MPIVLAYAEPPPAIASAPASRPSVITNPDWLHKPNGEDMANLYPKAAAAAKIEGRATLRCALTATGDLTDCAISGEEPVGQGFGDAALAMAPLFKMRPMTRDGVPVAGGKINIPIRFQLPHDPQMPSITLAIRCYGYYAAAAERTPGSAEAQVGATAWRMVVMMGSLPEHQRPSEFEQLLISLRKTAADKLDAEAFKAEREECRVALPVNSPMFDEMKRLFDQTPP